MQQDIVSIKVAQENIQKQIPKKRFSFWITKMFPKYQLLKDYFSIRDNKDLYKELYLIAIIIYDLVKFYIWIHIMKFSHNTENNISQLSREYISNPLERINQMSNNLTYNEIYKRYQLLSDQVLIDNWRYHQHQLQHKYDYDWVAFTVCEDLLRQRENTYLDNTYPKD